MLIMLPARTRRWLFLPAGLLIAVIGGIGTAMHGSLSPADVIRAVSVSAKPTPPLTEATAFSYGSLRPNRPVSVDQALDQSLSLPGVRGVLRGVAGAPSSRQITVAGRATVVTDYPFVVHGYVGHSGTPYPVGATIILRVPGGTNGRMRTVVADAPRVTSGMDLFVFVRDQGTLAGGNTTQVLVASSPYDVLEVRGGVVRGQKQWSRFAEPVQTFERHFRR